ncbi:MAG: hypothetical protein ABIQ99_04770 [Thermoflexales bacterium]
MFSALTSRPRAGPWPFILVIALAAITRLAALTLIDYRYDEAAGVHFAFAIADGQWLALAPHSGSIAAHPPLALYVMALPALLARDVFWVAGFRAALDVVAVGALAWIGTRTLGRVAGFVGSLAYAVGPWAIYFARKTWVSPIGLFGILALAGAFLLVGQHRARGWPIATLGVALAISSHLSGLYLLAGLGLVLLLGWRRLSPAVFLAGLIPLALVGVAYAIADTPTGFQNIQSLLRAQGGGVAGTAALDFAFWQTSGAKLAETSGLPALFVREGTIPDLVNFVSQALLILGMVLAVGHWLRDRKSEPARAALVAVGFWMGVVIPQLRANPAPQPHYVQLAIPAAFALVGYGAAWIWSKSDLLRSGWPRAFMALAMVGVMVFELAYWVGFNAAAAGPGPFPGYRPAQVEMTTVEAARKLDDIHCSGGGGIVILGPKADPDVNEAAAIYSTLLAAKRPRLLNSREAILVPAGCANWLVLPGDAPAMAAFGVKQTGVLRPPRLAGADKPKLGEWSTGIALTDAGIHLGESAWVTATLKVTAGEGGETRWFARLVRDGVQIASSDISGPARSIWRPGDTIGLWFDFGSLTLPSGTPIDVRIGSFRFPELSGSGVMLPDETWVDAVTIRLAAP